MTPENPISENPRRITLEDLKRAFSAHDTLSRESWIEMIAGETAMTLTDLIDEDLGLVLAYDDAVTKTREILNVFVAPWMIQRLNACRTGTVNGLFSENYAKEFFDLVYDMMVFYYLGDRSE